MTREEVLARHNAHCPGHGPFALACTLEWEQVDTYRRLDCASYGDCLDAVVLLGWPGWRCAEGCVDYRPADTLDIPRRTDEPDCRLDRVAGWAAEED